MATDKYPTLKVEIAFTGDRLTPGALTWTDVTADVRLDPPVEIHRGRSSELGTFAPGEATVTLNNRARKYDPRFTTGPYYGNLNPGRPIRIRCGGTWTAGTLSNIEMYYGFIDSWPQSYSDGNVDATVELHAYDMLSLLAPMTQPDPVFLYTMSTIGSCELFLRNCDGTTWFDSSGHARNMTKVIDPSTSAWRSAHFGDPKHGIPYSAPDFVNFYSAAQVGSSLAPGLLSTSVSGGRWSMPSFTVGTVYSVSFWFTCTSPAVPGDPHQSVYAIGGNNGGSTLTATLAGGLTLPAGTETGDGFYVGVGGPSYGLSSSTVASPGNDGKAHHVLLTNTGVVQALYYDGVLVDTDAGVVTSATFSTIDLGQYVWDGVSAEVVLSPPVSNTTLQDVTIWSKALTAAEALKVYQFGLGQISEDPSTRGSRLLTNVGVNQALLTAPNPGRGTCVEYLPAFQSTLDQLNLVAATEGGYLYAGAGASKILIQPRYHLWEDTVGKTSAYTITDDRTSATGVPYRQVATDYSAREVQNDITVSATGGAVASASDSTSITAYGKQQATVTTVLPSATEASTLANLLLNWRKTPVTRLSQPVELLPVRNPDTWYYVIGSEIGYRVTFDLMPGRVPPRISQQMSIEGITWVIRKDDWRLSLDLAPIPGDGVAGSTVFILDNATYGVLGTGILG